MRMPKNNFIGTAAWLFLVINLFKLPFQAFYWKNINGTTLFTDFLLIPALAIGFFTGIKLVNKLQDTSYRKVVIALTLVGSVKMLLRR
jgi:uncharacterized membrane protein YfcA